VDIQPIDGVDFGHVAVSADEIHGWFTVEHDGRGTGQTRRHISTGYSLCPVTASSTALISAKQCVCMENVIDSFG